MGLYLKSKKTGKVVEIVKKKRPNIKYRNRRNIAVAKPKGAKA